MIVYNIKMTIEKNMKKLPKILAMLIIAVAIFGMTVFAISFMSGCDSDINNFSVDFEHQASAFRNEGFTVTGPTTTPGTTSLLAVNLEGERIWIWRYSDSSMANMGWDTAGAYIAGTNMTRHRNGLYIWYGTAGALEIFNGGTFGSGGSNNNNNNQGGPSAVNIPGNVRVEESNVLSWVLRWNGSSPIGQYDIEIRNTETGHTDTIRQVGATHQLIFGAVDTLFSARVRAVISLPAEFTGWSSAVSYGAPLPEAPVNLTAVFGNTLRDVVLPAEWTWDSPPNTSVGNAGPVTFNATYNRGGAWIPIRTVPLVFLVDRATVYTLPVPSAVFGQTLSQVQLPDGWSWVDSGAIRVGNVGQRSHNARYTPADTDNFNTVDRAVTINVERATPTPTEPTNLVMAQGFALSSISLPVRWSWDNPAAIPTQSGTINFAATYTPNDLNNYNRVYRSFIVQVLPFDGFSYVTADASHTMALDTFGRIWTWGNGEQGQLGQPTISTFQFMSLTPQVLRVGHNDEALPTFTQVSAGSWHNLALDNQGRIWSWGNNAEGELGHNDRTTNILLPRRITSVSSAGGVTEMPRFTAVSAGTRFSVALCADNYLWSWGDGNSGRLGNGASGGFVLLPTRRTAAGAIFSQISAGGSHVLAIDFNNRVWSWGNNLQNQLGNGSTWSDTTPQIIELTGTAEGMNNVVAVNASTGGARSMALDADGRVWTWGDGPNNGSLGHGVTSFQNRPRRIDALTNIASVSAGGGHMIAVDENSRVWTWGAGGTGNLGHGNISHQLSPQMIDFDFGAVSMVSAGGRSMLIDSNNRIWAWGNNLQGQLGDGTTTNRNSPIVISPFTYLESSDASIKFLS